MNTQVISSARPPIGVNERMVPVEYIRECFAVDEAGELRWIDRPREHFATKAAHSKHKSQYIGRVAGGVVKGYRIVTLRFKGKKITFYIHRVVLALTQGAWPSGVVDHRNRDKRDNRPENLRDVPVDVNARNNGNPHGTGLFGAYRLKNSDKFKSQIMVNKKAVYLGMFDTAQEAHTTAIGAAARNVRLA